VFTADMNFVLEVTWVVETRSGIKWMTCDDFLWKEIGDYWVQSSKESP